MTRLSSTSEVKSRLDGRDLCRMFSAAMRLFEANVDKINALNVFPVPDGDTGTNMFLTLREVVKQAEDVQSDSAAEVMAAMARGALYEARGNSGVILCQFFKGVATGLAGKRSFGPSELAPALRLASDHAYTAVGEPVEGTMLTVISRVADGAERSAASGDSLPEMVEAVYQAAEEAVALTPTMLPVLRQAGVVDAGGQGFLVILEGVRRYVKGEAVEVVEVPTPEPVGVEIGAGTVSAAFLEATDEELYGYCTQFLIQGQGLSADVVREAVSSLADSTAVVGDETMVKVHVHAHDPGPIISYAVTLGTLSQVNIENMDRQHREYSVARRQEVGVGPAVAEAASIGVVAVAWGQGLERVFADLGAAAVLPAGDTMNPSVQQILEIIEAVPSENVIFLPNNRNIVPAAQRAVELSGKKVKVVPSKTIPQGVAAMLAFHPERGLEDNSSEMAGALAGIRVGEVCRALRPVKLHGLTVEEGQIIGFMERKMLVAGDEPSDVLVSLLKASEISEGSLVTLYWGGGLSEQEADAARRRVEEAFSEMEVETVSGGQPHYFYIVSIE